MTSNKRAYEVVVIGGGQSALALGFYLRHSALSYLILDDQQSPGGSWQHTWTSLRAFSPAQWSSLPGWLMPTGSTPNASEYPSRDDVVKYLADYESRYALPVEHGVHVVSVDAGTPDDPTLFRIRTGSTAELRTRAVISATGNRPYTPEIPGRSQFTGLQLHSRDYISPASFQHMRVVVVGGGNSAAQIVSELTAPDSGVASVQWATREPPRFLPDDIDGRYLFDQATERYNALKAGLAPPTPLSLGDIVMVPPVRAARDRGALVATPMFERLSADGAVWSDRRTTHEDAIIWATGFIPALEHLTPLGVINDKRRVDIAEDSTTRSALIPRLWLVGYGNWTGYASATLIGVGRSARATVAEVRSELERHQ